MRPKKYALEQDHLQSAAIADTKFLATMSPKQAQTAPQTDEKKRNANAGLLASKTRVNSRGWSRFWSFTHAVAKDMR